MNYLNVTYEQLLQDFRARLNSDPRFKNIGSATIYGMFQEMLCACMDMTNFYLQRTAEESFISTARLDSSVIKHGKGLGYNPRRAIPSKCELIIRLKGPLPKTLVKGTELIFNQELMDLSFNGEKYILDSGYSYVLTEEDIVNGQSNDWTKDLYFAVPNESATYIPLAGISYYDTQFTTPIMCFQGERKTVEFLGTANLDKIGTLSQFYDINDLDFSNWYGNRDPFAVSNNKYNKALSWCKVGIGPDIDTAFETENLYDVETQAIHLNENVVRRKYRDDHGLPLKVCLVDTNSDKTVRVSFSTEPNICDTGLKSVKDNLYVKYIATKGKKCNTTGVKGSIMSHNNNIKVSVNGYVVDVTNNVQFIINSDIYGGEYFENQNSIRINAPSYFSSGGKLITKNDYMSYFRSLTNPIAVQNALVYGQQEIQNNLQTDIVHKLIQNNVFYSLLGHLYTKHNGNWEPVNLLTNYETNEATIYSDKYLDHICDFIKMLYSYEGYYNKIFNAVADEQWLKNIRLIYDNCRDKMELNSILMPMVPFVQYYDVVGTVYVDPLTDIESYTTDMKNKLYEYLDQKLATERKIYKSEIIDLYNKNEKTKAVDIDIRVSSIVSSPSMTYKWNDCYNSDFRILKNGNLSSYTSIRSTVKSDYDIDKMYGAGWWNEIQISKVDQSGNPITAEIFQDRKVKLKIVFGDAEKAEDGCYITKNTVTYSINCDSTSDDKYIYLYPLAIQHEGNTVSYRYDPTTHGTILNSDTDKEITNITQDGVIDLEIILATDDDFASTSNFSTENLDDYKIQPDLFSYYIVNGLKSWLDNLQKTEPLKYYIDLLVGDFNTGPITFDTETTRIRSEEIIRRGNLNTPLTSSISENSFWNYFIPTFVLSCYSNTSYADRKAITDESSYDSIEWLAASKLIMDIYALVKPGICDSILDDNNNIVNFSTDMEVPVVFNKINVKYKMT